MWKISLAQNCWWLLVTQRLKPSNFSGACMSSHGMAALTSVRESQDCASRCWVRGVISWNRWDTLTRVWMWALQSVLLRRVDWITLCFSAKIPVCAWFCLFCSLVLKHKRCFHVIWQAPLQTYRLRGGKIHWFFLTRGCFKNEIVVCGTIKLNPSTIRIRRSNRKHSTFGGGKALYL